MSSEPGQVSLDGFILAKLEDGQYALSLPETAAVLTVMPASGTEVTRQPVHPSSASPGVFELTVQPLDQVKVDDRFTMVLEHLPSDRQPNGVHTVECVEDGVVHWKEGGRSPLRDVVAGRRWRRISE